MKTIIPMLLLTAFVAHADTAVDNLSCDRSGKCVRGTIMLHDAPLTIEQERAKLASQRQAEADKAKARADARTHVADCSSGKLTGDACSGAALAKDIDALIPGDPNP